jgi:hypothetical protein
MASLIRTGRRLARPLAVLVLGLLLAVPAPPSPITSR